MVILSWRISWTITSSSVWPSWRSTKGRAPSINSSQRFWMRAVSLKRPPTLFTISSLLRASIIVRSPFVVRSPFFEDGLNFSDGVVEVVVHDVPVERLGALGHVDLALGGAEPAVD